ncbi:emopamil-binding family protein [Mycobacterium sp. OTB74]|uniref:EXPERA domain-containing protein n=1 Tax=Mycobacterium sp. OTB74 TaxID=1853452 RepID=UPI0024738195|nr:emopamil-binding family protein [Mycobacterium sp. OTB74]MDH6247568.1 hypothetical protein [Mycobacterium sp. OTB74]
MTVSSPASDGAIAPNQAPLPLSERRYDWLFIAAFVLFASTSFCGDLVNLLMRPDPDSPYLMARLVYRVYAEGADPLLIANPRFLQAGAGVSALVFGSFYLVLIYAFVKGRDWIRLPSIFYAGMVVQTTFLVLVVGIAGDAPLFKMVCGAAYTGFDYTFTDVPKVLLYNVPYIVIPLLLVARMWRPHPFCRPIGRRN